MTDADRVTTERTTRIQGLSVLAHRLTQALATRGPSPDGRRLGSSWATVETPTPFARSPLMARNGNKDLKEAT